jgi:hypothetical protein
VDALGREHMGPDQQHERHQGCRRGTDPVRERRDVELDAFARIDRALAVERNPPLKAAFRKTAGL